MLQTITTDAPVAVFVGLATIGVQFDRSRWTIARWIRKDDFPAARLPGGTWAVTPSLIDNWLIERRARDPVFAGADDSQGQTDG